MIENISVNNVSAPPPPPASPSYKLCIYDFVDPLDAKDLAVTKVINLNSTVDKDKKDAKDILEHWLPIDYAKAILDGVRRQNIWLGIGKRGIKVVERWASHPWIPNEISITKQVNGKDQTIKVTEADTALITKDVLYKEVIGLDKLYSHTTATSTLASPPTEVWFSAKPAWQHPNNIIDHIKNIPKDDTILNGDNAYLFKTIPYSDLKDFVKKMGEQLKKVTQEKAIDFDKLGKDNCTPDTNLDCDNLCGAWYVVEVESKTPDFKDQNNLGTNRLRVCVPIGLIKPTSPTDPTPIKNIIRQNR